MDAITKTQRSFALKALHNPTHRFDDLYHLIGREDWIAYALAAVLDNTGSRSPGIDGVSKKHLATADAQQRFISELQAELKTGRFRPTPVRRQYIPKTGGKLRPLGIPTIKDRVVQMLLKMLLEPIWETDFLKCSHGFRPGRRTMDAIAPLYGLMNPKVKCYWVVEGDIKGCFDHIDHAILLNLVEQRVADRRIVTLIRRFLKAGVFEEETVRPTESGTPQGGIFSPLLANLYLTELDRYWWQHYGGLSEYQKRQRRKAGAGNPQLLRYADDFLLVTNGPKQEAYQLRDELQQFLADTLKLELSLEKTAVTHVNAGFDFLGYHIQRYRRTPRGRPVVLVTPSKPSQERLKTKVRDMTGRHRGVDNEVHKVIALNQLLRGWVGYYRYVTVKAIAHSLDFWVERRLAAWLCEKHQRGIRHILRKYHRRQGQRGNFAVTNERGRLLFLYRMVDVPHQNYPLQRRGNPYLEGWSTVSEALEIPITAPVWLGNNRRSWWQDLRHLVLERDGYRCQNPQCGTSDQLDVHHKQWKKDGGGNHLANLTTLCEACHRLEQQGLLIVNW